MQVAGFNIVSQDTFEYITNVKKYKGQTQGEYMHTHGKDSYPQFVKDVQGVMSRNLSVVERLEGMPLKGMLEVMNSPNDASIGHIAGSISQWELTRDILNGKKNGRLVGWDLETVGDITSRNYDGYAGITEFGIVERLYRNGYRLKKDDTMEHSLAIGFDPKQAERLRALVTQFEREGWDSLADEFQSPETLSAKQSTLQRLSMIGSRVDAQGNIVPITSKQMHFRYQSQLIPQLGNKEFLTVRELGPANFNPATMRAAIQLQVQAYEAGATPEAVLPAAIDYITKAAQDDSTGLYGSNIRFDVASLSNEGARYKINVDAEALYYGTVDTVDGTRLIASSRAESAGTLADSLHRGMPANINQATSTESQMQIQQMDALQTHYAPRDILNELELVSLRNYEDGKTYVDTVLDAQSQMKSVSYDLQESMFLINRGHVVNDNADIVLIDGEASMQTYPMSNRYWTLGEHAGYVTIEDGNGEMRNVYMMEFLTPDDDRISVYKSFKTEEDGRDFIRKNTTIVKNTEITDVQVSDQYVMDILDKGRREFDRMFDASAVTVDSSGEEGGFKRLREYMQLMDELEADGIKAKEASPSLLRRIRAHELAKDSKSRVLKSEYQVEAFTGMLERLSDERQLLDDIITSLENTGQNNSERTMLAQRARQAIIDTIAGQEKYIAYHAGEGRYALTDAFGVDIVTPSGTRRINAQYVSTAASNIDNALRGLSEKEIRDVIDDLSARHVIDTDTADELIHSLHVNYISSSTYNFNRDLAYKLTQVTAPLHDVENPLSYFVDIQTGVIADDSPQTAALKAKTTHSIADDLYTGAKSRYVIKDAKASRTFRLGGLYKTQKLHDVMLDTIIETSNHYPIRYYGTMQSFNGALDAVQTKLGYSADEMDLIRDLIGATDKQSAKPYSIQRYQSKGLQTFLLDPEDVNKNAYLLVTNREHSNAVIELLTNGELVPEKQLDSFGHIRDTFGKHAAIIELHSVNRYDIGDLPKELAGIMGTDRATLVSANQSNKYEKFLTPVLDVYSTKADGKVYAKIGSGVTDMVTSIRLVQNSAIQRILNDEDFDAATTLIRRSQNKRLNQLAAPSSYHGHYMDGTIRRVANYHPADFLHAYEMNVEGLFTLMEKFTGTEDDNDIKQMLRLFNEQNNVVGYNPRKPLTNGQYSSILHSTTFKEFYSKTLFLDTIASDGAIAEAISHAGVGGTYDKTIFGLLQTAVRDDVTGLFDESVSKALDDFAVSLPYINQIVPESAIKHSLISFIRPGDFNVLSGLYSTLRPTYTQQNRTRYLEIDDATRRLLEDDGYTYIGQASMSKLEYGIKKSLSDAGLTSPNGSRFDSQYRSITTRFKQLSDMELQGKYAYIAENIDDIATELGLDATKLRTTFGYMRNDLSTVNEGKWFYDPLLGNQEFFRDADAKRITIAQDIENLDIDKTRTQLEKFRNQEIKPGSVIAITKDGRNVFYEGATAVMNDFNVNELLEEGYTYVLPNRSRINDVKLMIDSEKAMAHTIDADQLLRYAKGVITSRNEAIQYSHALFQYVFDKSMVVGNIPGFKHDNNFASPSVWNTITTAYRRAGKSDLLFDMLTSTPELSPYFADWNLGLGAYGEILVDNGSSTHLTTAIRELEMFIREKPGFMGDAARTINDGIIQSLNEQTLNGIIMGNVQQVLVNEHLSDSFRLDQRIEQGIRLRTWTPDLPVNDDLDIRYLQALKDYAMSDTLGQAENFMNPHLGAIRDIADFYNTQRLGKTRGYNAAVKQNQANAMGMMEALRYYAKPEAFDVNSKNIIQVKISDFMKSHYVPKSGASTEDFQKFLFFIDGKPSEWLQDLAKQQGKQLSGASYSLYLDLEQTVQYGNHKMRGVVIPMQNLTKAVQGDQFYKDSQRVITRFLDELIDITKTPSKDGQKTFNGVITDFVAGLSKQTAIMKKDSDMYKAFGRIDLPNAGQYQAIDETPALIDSMMTSTVQANLQRQKEIRKLFNEGKTSSKLIKEYDALQKEIASVLSASAQEIRKATDVLPELTALKSSPLKDLSVITIDKKAYYNNLVAIGEEGFRARGYDFGQVGMDLVNAYLNDNYSNIPNIANKTPFRVTDEEVRIVSERLRKLGIKDIDETNLLPRLNEYLTDTYGQSLRDAIDTKKVNRAIVSGRLQEIFGTFEDIGKRYTREVGIFAEQVRYPMFGSQPLVNLVLDDSIQGLGARFFNPAMSTYTNVDFDGDTVFLHLIMDGGSFAKRNSTRFATALGVHQRSVKFNNDLIAEIIEKGASLKVDDLNDYYGITAHMLSTFRKDQYNEALSTWAKNNHIGFRSIKDLTAGQILAAERSTEMMKAWADAGLNTLLDKGIIRASLAVLTRKDNIGSISTPNWNLRTTIEALTKDATLDAAQQLEFKNILDDMGNMRTSMRGLTGITEQKGIDVKHIVDDLGIAETPKWNIGLSQMFNASRNLRREGLTNLVKASNHVLFGNASDAEIRQIVEDIMNTTREELKKRADVSKEDIDIAKAYLRGVYDVSLHPRAVELFNISIKKGSWNDELRRVLFSGEIMGIQPGTLEANFEKAIMSSYSDETIILNRNNVYMRTGNIEDGLRYTGWMQDVDGSQGDYIVLKEVSLEDDKFLTATGKTKRFGGKGISNTDTNAEINKFLHGHRDMLLGNAKALRESEVTRSALFALTRQQTSIDILNDLTLTKDGKIKGFSQATIDALSSQQLALGTDVPRWIDLKNAQEFYHELQAVGDLYNYAVASEQLTNHPTVDALIKQVNADIVQNADKYANSTEFHSYADVFRKFVTDTLGGQSVVARAEAKKASLGSFATKEFVTQFQESLDFLNGKLYDIMNAKSRLEKSFSAIRTELDALDKTKLGDALQPLEDLMASSEDTINQVLNDLRKANAQTVAEAQNRMYKLFQNTAQMDIQFGWDDITGYSKIGFGEYMGVQLRQLTDADKKTIFSNIDSILNGPSAAKMSALQRHAVEQTKRALEEYKPPLKNAYVSSTRIFASSTPDVDKIIYENQKLLDEVFDSFKDIIDDVRAPIDNTHRKRVTSDWFDNAKKGLSGLTMKHVGIGVASLAALGVVNNILHNDKKQTPLAPARRPDGNVAPEAHNNGVAPMSKKQVVYHDSGSGYNFQVSTKTRNYIDDMNNARLIGMAGGGGASVYSQSDMSGVTDNWLENKFAELV